MIIAILALPALLWMILRISMSAGPYNMDQGQHRGSFFPLLILYSVFAYIILIASACGAFFSYCADQNWPAFLFLSAGIEALLFAGFLVFFYEGYMHATASGTSNYTLNKYAVVLSLGVSAVVTFVLAVGLMVAGVAVK
jgi:hypothetical protein